MISDWDIGKLVIWNNAFISSDVGSKAKRNAGKENNACGGYLMQPGNNVSRWNRKRKQKRLSRTMIRDGTRIINISVRRKEQWHITRI